MISCLSIDLRRERKYSLKLREMEQVQEEDRKERQKSEYAYNVMNIRSCVFRKPASDLPEVAVKRRQKDAQAKATKRLMSYLEFSSRVQPRVQSSAFT